MTQLLAETWHPAAEHADGGDDWRLDALCAETDPALFFPETGASTMPAKLVCRRCAVTDECLVDAIRHNERFGVWGGLSERERRAIRRSAR